MPENINISAVTCGQEKCLTVGKHEHLIRIKKKKNDKKEVIKFHNKLEDAAVEVVFYDENDKGENALDNFCESDTITDKLTIAKKSKIECTINQELHVGDYAYTVSATGYQMLDPIIIIEPSSPENQTINIVAIGGLLIAASLLAFWLGARKNSGTP